MIEWTELKPYQNDKRRSFEELCYQIAKGLYGEMGRFTSIDDSGGGDGVEFYLTLSNGDQWGWQAKFYYPEPRLSESGRKRSIKESLEKACEVHPRLKKWILCTPTNFTPRKGKSQGEQVWFDNTLRQSIPPNMDVELEHWGDSDFNNWLSKPRFSGRRNYFFGELELNLDWFKGQFEKQMAGVGDKFDSSLHTETYVDAEIHALLGDKAFTHQITEWIEKLEEDLPDLKEAIDDLKRPIPYIEWSEEENSKVVKAAKSLQDALVNIIDKFEQTRNILDKQELTIVQAIDWRASYDQLRKVFDHYEKVTMESGISKMKCTIKKEDEEQALRKASSVVHGPRNLVARLLDKFFPSVIWKQGLINKSDLHILGDAGIGKTHIACNICDDRLKNGLPALFVRGNLFTTEQSIESQLRTILDIPPSYSWHDFFQALSAVAEAYKTRIPLIIDGLNESVHNGTFSKIWELGLTGFIQEITQAKNLVLITTCRRSYKETIWKDATLKEYNPKKLIWKNNDSPNLFYADGFDTDEVKQEAIGKYFNAYKIKADITLAPLMQFEHPLHLKIFCETKNRERKTEMQVYVGEQTLFEVFDEYLEQCNETVCTRFGVRRGTLVVQPILNKIAEHLWQNRSRNIPVEELVKLTDNQLLSDLNWPTSKARAIEAEGLLICRDRIEGKDKMSFTYDLLGGYLIAKYLVEQAADDVQAFLNSEEVVALLFGKDYQTLHPMHEGICRCLAAFLPAKTGKLLHEFLDNRKVFGLSIRALFEISPKHINEKYTNLVTRLFDQYPDSRDWFFKLAETTVGHPEHPFNASFWSERFSALSMAERDLSWSEYIRLYRESFEKRLNRFEETCQSDQELSDIGKERLHLLAEYIMWILTSTVRPLRDQATRALYWYGRRFPQEFFDLVIKSFTINDPYVSERMLAATYGIAMAHHNNFEDSSFLEEVLPVYGQELYENIFKPNAPQATTHILARDYTKRTIDIALIYHPDLLTEEERERITPPFTDGGIREWGERENKEEGFPPIQMDFKNYTLKGLINFDNSAANDYKKIITNVYWRIYDLGFTNERFLEFDSHIAEENYRKYGRSGDGRKTDRYGKKYSWIAFYELAGFRRDNNLLSDLYGDGRIFGGDIDPSFPDEHREYNLIREDFLGDREASTEQWVLKTPPPDLTPYLNVDQLWDEQGSWVLLHGHLSQEDKPASRKMSAWMQGLIVKPENVDEIVEILNRQEIIDGNTVPFIPEDYRTYAGEMPWSDTFPTNEWEEFSFEIGKDIVLHEQSELLRDGEPISLHEEFQFWHSAPDLIEKEDEEILKERLSEQNLKIEIKMVEVEQPKYQQFKVLVPVRDNCWEESCSAANPRRSIAVPTREISDCLNLYKKPQGFDFFEKDDNRRASISFEYGDIWSNSQNFTYLRRDLLERFLAEIGGELIWVIWGNRLLVSENYDGAYKTFQEVKTYYKI